MRVVLGICLLLVSVLASPAETVVAGLSREQVSITTDFSGSDILIYGAVKRNTPIADGPPLEVVITVAGPAEPITVRKKDRRYGIWINTDAITVDRAPSFYAVATTGPLSDVLRSIEDQRHSITIDKAIRVVGIPSSVTNVNAFREALVRIRTEARLYQQLENNVKLTDDTLFSTTVDLPANLVEGDYTTSIFLTRDGRVIDKHVTTIQVSKVGLERWIYNLAHQQPLIYGLLSLFIAITAGWLASAMFRFVRF